MKKWKVKPLKWSQSRDLIMFFSGLVGVAYETLAGLERPTLLILFAAMMGLPAFIDKGNPGPPNEPEK